MIQIELNFREHVPIYIQLMDQIKHLIAIGDLKPGDQLPTVRQLAADLRVNFNTVARAYRMLDDNGIISTQHGRGTFILDKPSEKEMKVLRQQDLVRLTEHYVKEVFRLDYSADEIKKAINEMLEALEKENKDKK